ncbi:MAG: tetratricopeptide repeat protein, partial [Bacteroidia bacterium]|nr:tetratricopeptide repeat protein [Bacteroidia bacterium]
MSIWSAEIKELEKLYGSLKGQLPDLEKELERLIKADDENMILLYSRRCLEVIITDLCECELKRPRKTEPLKGIIDKLHKEEKVPSNIITSMDHLNSLSAYGAHPKDFDPEQVKPVLNNLSTIIKWYLKYKEPRTDVKAKPAEETRQEIKSTENVKKDITISRKRLAGILGGSIGVIASIFAVLYFSNIIGGGKQTKEIDKSIAVLPFKLLSDEPDKQYLADGMMDAITLHLSKIKGLRVIGRTSVEQYRNPSKTTTAIGRELDVEFLLEGSFQKFGDNVRLIVQLIKTGKEGHIWANNYDRNWSDIFAVQSEVAQAVAAELYASITPEEKKLIENVPTKNIEAYDLYLQGRYFWDLGGRDNLNKSIEFYQKALKIDQDYALAYSGLAASYTKYAFTGLSPRRDVMPQAKSAAMNALKIDSTLGEAHAELALTRAINDWDWTESEKGFKRAIELNPNYAGGHIRYAWLLAVVGRLDEGIQEAKRAHELDPLSVDIWLYYGWNYYVARDYDSAIEEYRKILDLFPNEGSAHTWIAMALLQKGLHNEAIEECSKNESGPSRNWKHGYIYGIAGKREKALDILNYYLDLSKKEFVWPTNIVFIYIGLGEKDKAFEWLEKTYKEHEAYLDLLQVEPMYDPLRSDPRFKDLLKKMNFPDQ